MARAANDSRRRVRRGLAINPAALRRARIDAGLSLARAADGIVSRQAFSQFELGQARPALRTLQAIAVRLGVPTGTLLARPHDPREQAMRTLEDQRRWSDLERLARRVLADRNVTPRTQAVASFYLGRAVLDWAPEEALDQFRLAQSQLASLGEPWLAAEARDWEGATLYLMQDGAALDVGRDALARYRKLTDRDPAVEARILEHIGSYLLQRAEIGEALSTYRQAIDVAGKVLNLVRLANIYHGLASGCVRIGETRQALDYFERAVHFSRTHHDVRGGRPSPNLARLENDYGECLVRLGRWERAEDMIRAALDHFAAAGVLAGQTHALLSMGDLKHRQRQPEEAIHWTGEAIDLAQRLGERVSLAVGYQQLGEIRASLGDHDRFEACFSRAFELLADFPERRAEAVERYRRTRAADSAPLEG